jgi:hypothetical protein
VLKGIPGTTSTNLANEHRKLVLRRLVATVIHLLIFICSYSSAHAYPVFTSNYGTYFSPPKDQLQNGIWLLQNPLSIRVVVLRGGPGANIQRRHA